MKRIRFNLTKACLIFATFTESLYKNMGILPSIFQEISPFLSNNYTLVCHWYMFKALRLLVY